MVYDGCYYRVPANAQTIVRSDCESKGGQLATIYSQNQFTSLLTWAYGSLPYGSCPHAFWIGYQRTSQSGDFVWLDGSQSTYQCWASKQPDNYNKIEQCAAAYAHYSGGMPYAWNDEECKGVREGLCKLPCSPGGLLFEVNNNDWLN